MFAVTCLVTGIEFSCALCDTGSSVSVLPKVMADHLGLKIEPSEDSFTFVDHSARNSGGIQIGNALVPVDFHVLENKENKNHSLLLGRAFMATTSNTGVNNTGFIAARHCDFEDEYETEYSRSIDSRTPPSIDIAIQPPIDKHPGESIDSSPANETFALAEQCYPSFAVSTQTQKSIYYHHGETISRQGDYSIGSWTDESHHESFAVDTALPEMQSDEYDEDYHRAKNIEHHGLAMDDRGLLHTSFAHATSTSIDSDFRPLIYYGFDPFSSIGSRRPSTSHGWTHFHISKEDIAEIIFMNGYSNFFNPKNRSEDPPSIDNAAAPSIDGHLECRRSTFHQNMKRKPRWKNTKASIPTVPEQDSYNKVEIDDISWLTTRTYEMKQDTTILQRPHAVGAGRSKLIAGHVQPSIDAHIQASIDARLTSFEDLLQSFTYRLDGVNYPLQPSPSIYRRTRPSIDDDYAALRNKLELNDILESTYARLGMQQRMIGNLQHRMHAGEMRPGQHRSTMRHQKRSTLLHSVLIVGEKYSGTTFLQAPGRIQTSGSPFLERSGSPVSGTPVSVPGTASSSKKRQIADKEKLPYF
ncbi:hypothetical protein DY000_02015487 [Brassica cretica]|uniref:Peptidase A2 domain-containing protein n=1 Tax=Brassica cretica TaxID=69181 RepID=A0ABQ7CSR1_BRACR|nr:hypothetical protein DY000_02015487 [Brassica cretica]